MSLRYGVVATTAPGVTAQDTTHSEVEPLEWAMLAKCLDGIGGARGREAARGGREGRDRSLVEVDGEKKKLRQ